MSTLLLLTAFVLFGILAFRLHKRLEEMYPLASDMYWAKYIPVLGLALIGMVAGGPFLAYVPGMALMGWAIYLAARAPQ